MEWLSEHAWETWLALMMLLAIGEMLSLDLVLGMLAVGAGVGLIAALVGLPGIAQVLLGLGAAVACLALIRPSLLKRLHNSPELKLGHTQLIGMRGVVTHEITAGTPGQVKLGGETWSAQPFDDSLTIPLGAPVEVFEIRGATAYVYPLGELDTPTEPKA